jgi:fatty aldehyde decarbonylase
MWMEEANFKKSSLTERSTNEHPAHVWRDVLAQAVTGELVAALNYEALAGICTEPDEKAEALEHAESEKGHAARFTAAGRDLGITVAADVYALYWKRMRSAFMSRVRDADFVGCLLVQEVMLESFAVAGYQQIAQVAPGKLGKTFEVIAIEEAEHIDHAVGMLREERTSNSEAFDAKVYRLHGEVMTTFAEMVAREDRGGHCGLCYGNCVKLSLPGVGLSISNIRGASLHHYLKILDAIGLPGEATLGWVAQLPV